MTEEIIHICPVCDMLGTFETETLKHNQKTLHFCSRQCKETFTAHPTLYLGKADREEDIKRRTLHMAEPLDDETAKQLTSCLERLMGIKEVHVDGDKVRITYDLLQVTEKVIEKTLAEAKLPLSGSWLEKLHRAWIQGSEETELDNLAAKPAPRCHQTPPG